MSFSTLASNEGFARYLVCINFLPWQNLGAVNIHVQFLPCVENGLDSPARRRFLEFFSALDQKRWSFVFIFLETSKVTMFGWWNTLTKEEAQAVFAPVMSWKDVKVVFDPENNPTYFQQYAKNPKTGKAYLTDAFLTDANARPFNQGDPLNWYWAYESGQTLPVESWDQVADWATDMYKLGISSIKLDGTKALAGKFAWTGDTSFNPKFYSTLAMVYSPMVIIPNLHPSLSSELWPGQCKDAKNLASCIDPTSQMMLGSQCKQASLKSYFAGSGSYINENNPFDEDWREQQWGVNYPRLLKIKRRYDPSGVFVCHHCVGSDQYVFTEESRGYCLAEAGDVCPFFHGDKLGPGAPTGLPTPPAPPLTWAQCKAGQDPCNVCKQAAPCFTEAACAAVSDGTWQGVYGDCNIGGASACAPCFKERKCFLDRASYSSDACDYPTTTKSTDTTCPKCGTLKKSGKVSCCAPGGAWFNKCGNDGDPKFDHTWSEGAKACESTYSSSDMFEHVNAKGIWS